MTKIIYSSVQNVLGMVAWVTLLLSLISLMTSCNYKGENKIVNYTENLHKERNEMVVSKVINEDSIELSRKRNKQISDSLTLKEHRVYYVDYSWSMKDTIGKDGPILLDLVKDSLKKSIREIKSDNVYIEIIPFLDSELWKGNGGKPIDVFQISKNKTFLKSDLERLDAFINGIHAIQRPKGDKKNNGHYNTHHSIAINDFLHNRIGNKNQYHVMILLTDGKDESKKDNLPSGMSILDGEWAKLTNDNYVFGIFGDVTGKISDSLPNRFKGNGVNRLYYQEGLNFGFNVIILEQPKAVEHRTNNMTEIHFGGHLPRFTNTVQRDPDNCYQFTLIQPENHTEPLRIRVDTLTASNERPNTLNYKFKLCYDTIKNSRVILSHKEIDLTVIDVKTPNIKLFVPNHVKDSLPCVSQDLEYCKKLFGKLDPEWSDTLTIKISYEKSNDAKYNERYNTIKLRISNLPDYVTLIGGNEYSLNKPSDTLSIVLTLNHSSAELCDDLNINGCLEVIGAEDLKEVFVNQMPLDYIKSSMTIGAIKIKTDKQWHPLLILLLALLVLWAVYVLIRRLYREGKPRFKKNGQINFDNTIVFQNPDGDFIVKDRVISSNSCNLHINQLNIVPVNKIIIQRDVQCKQLDSKWHGLTLIMNATIPHTIRTIHIVPSLFHLAKIIIFYNDNSKTTLTIDYKNTEFEYSIPETDNYIITHL